MPYFSKEEFTVPRVHLNGTSKAELLSQASEAAVALNEAVAAVVRASPHGRDYYPLDKHGQRSVVNVAIEERAAVLKALESIRDKFVTLHEAIEEQQGGR